MKRRALLITLVAAVPLTATAAPDGAASHRPCAVRGAEVGARGAEVVVTARSRAPRRDGRPSYGDVVVACHRPTGRRVRLDERRAADDPDGFLDLVRVAGPYVVYAIGSRSACSSCSGSHRVERRDLRAPARPPLVTTGCGGGGAITDLVLDRNGRVGFICFRSANVAGEAGDLVEVRAVDRDGRRLLDRTTAFDRRIAAGSLSLVRGRLAWTVAGEPRSAQLRASRSS